MISLRALAPFAAAGLEKANPKPWEMSGKIGPDTSQSSREPRPKLVYTKPRVPTTLPLVHPGYGVSRSFTGRSGVLSDGDDTGGNTGGDVSRAGSCGSRRAAAFIAAICTRPAFGASLGVTDAAAGGGVGCMG